MLRCIRPAQMIFMYIIKKDFFFTFTNNFNVYKAETNVVSLANQNYNMIATGYLRTEICIYLGLGIS